MLRVNFLEIEKHIAAEERKNIYRKPNIARSWNSVTGGLSDLDKKSFLLLDLFVF